MNGRFAIPVDGLVLLTYIPLKGLIVLYKGKGKKGKDMERSCQTENVFKAAYKNIIDNRYRNLSQVEKEIIKNAIDDANTFEEMLLIAFAAIAGESEPKR